jgi:hypothetical protein
MLWAAGQAGGVWTAIGEWPASNCGWVRRVDIAANGLVPCVRLHESGGLRVLLVWYCQSNSNRVCWDHHGWCWAGGASGSSNWMNSA